MPAQLLALKDLETRFWLRSVAIGGWASLIVGASGLAYAFVYTDGTDEMGIVLTIVVVMAIGAAALWLFPWRRFARSHLREVLVLSWSLLIVAAITLMAAFDGGAKSPLALAIILPSIFASLAFSRARVLVVGIAAEAGFALLCLIGAPGGGTAIVGAVVLGAAITIGARQADFHQEWRRQLARHSLTDPLTGLLNRRGMAEASAGAFEGLRRAHVTMILIDLDLFKTYNDVYGHRAGDDLLRWVGAELLDSVRDGDIAARMGGDEFAVLLPETDAEAAQPLIAAISERLAQRVPHSLGTASSPEDGPSVDQLYLVADAQLYEHKFARSRRSEQRPRVTL